MYEIHEKSTFVVKEPSGSILGFIHPYFGHDKVTGKIVWVNKVGLIPAVNLLNQDTAFFISGMLVKINEKLEKIIGPDEFLEDHHIKRAIEELERGEDNV